MRWQLCCRAPADDGSEGLRAVHAAGGLTIAQQSDTARFEGMPSSAVLTGAVDLVLPPGEIGATLSRILAAPPLTADLCARRHDHEALVQDILMTLRRATGTDFTGYKRSTLLRQIGRRSALPELRRPGRLSPAIAGADAKKPAP